MGERYRIGLSEHREYPRCMHGDVWSYQGDHLGIGGSGNIARATQEALCIM